MEYFKIYNETYSFAQNAIRRALILKFKKVKEKNRPFSTINNDFLRWAKGFSENRFENKFIELEPKAFTAFRDRWKSYQGEKQQVIQWVLEDEVKAAYQNQTHYKSYNNFIFELAKYDAFSEVIRHFHCYYSYYELIYEQNKYEYFYLKDFDGHGYESSQEYNEMLDKKYPYRIKERMLKEKQLKVIQKAQIKKPDGVTELIESFKDDERILIVSILYNQIFRVKVKPNMSLTNFIKLLKIAGSYEDLSIFSQKAESNTLYRKAHAGLDYYSSKSSQLKLINSILSKLKNYDFDFITDNLNIELAKINNSKS